MAMERSVLSTQTNMVLTEATVDVPVNQAELSASEDLPF